MEVAPIKSTRIYEEIVRQVKQMIAEGRLKSGDRLPPERDLAEKFVVSRSSVREALRALESLGLVEIRPGEGTFVREVSVESLIEPLALMMVSQRGALAELFEARRLLEPGIAALAASPARRSPRWSGSSKSSPKRSPRAGRASSRTPPFTPRSASPPTTARSRGSRTRSWTS